MTDHSAGDFYRRGTGKGANLLAPKSTPVQGSASWVSPTTGEPILVKEARVKSNDVLKQVTKCIYNKRAFDRLTPSAVNDIFPSISASKRNSTPVLAVKLANGQFEIITGMRRSYAVSLCDDAELVIHYTDSMSDEDKQLLADTSDTYDKPSILDFGFSLIPYKELLGASYSVRQAAKAFGVNKSYVHDAERAASLPDQLFSLFPGLGFISRTFLRSVAGLNASNDEIIKAIHGLSPVRLASTLNDEQDERTELKKLSSKLEKNILELLNVKKTTPNDNQPLESDWLSAKFVKGVETKVTKKHVVINIPKGIADSDIGKELIKLLSEQNS